MAESHARGIYIVKEKIDCNRKTQKLEDKHGILVDKEIYPFMMQEFFEDLHLIHGKFKFDIRFYVLIANVEPLKLYTAPHSSFMRISPVPYGTKSQK